jgi:hypothetical protein
VHILPLERYLIFVYVYTHHLNIIRQIKSNRMRWAGYVALMGEERKLYKMVGKLEGKRPLTLKTEK